MTILDLLLIANGLLSTTYGWGEASCGPSKAPVPCVKGAITASGEEFDPSVPSAAIAAPKSLRMRAMYIGLRVVGGRCVRVRLNDKSNPRWIGNRGFDLSPAAVELVTGEPARSTWSAPLELCTL